MSMTLPQLAEAYGQVRDYLAVAQSAAVEQQRAGLPLEPAVEAELITLRARARQLRVQYVATQRRLSADGRARFAAWRDGVDAAVLR